jgi:hypothetical protein
LAEADQMIATSTVKNLVAESTYAFNSLGSGELRGIPHEWELYSVSH